MPKGIQYFLIFLLVPTFAEGINAKDFLVTVPGIPFSLGRLSFISAGVFGLLYNRNFYFKSNLLRGLMLIFFGSIVGAIFSDNFSESISRALGNVVLLVGAIGVASLCNNDTLKRSFDVFFILNLAYWTYYVFSLVILSGLSAMSYSKLFTTEGAVNHHVVGINSSVSCIYIALRFFYKQQKFSIFGYLIIFFGILNCVLSETRSNLIITILVLFLILIFSNIKFARLLFVAIPVLVLMFFVLSDIASINDSVIQRFDITDEDYQQRTTGMRFEYIYGAFEAIAVNPFGRGVFGAEIESGNFGSTMVHNQYLTFILAGGLFAILGIFLWLKEFIKIFRFTVRFKDLSEGFYYAVVFSMICFLITLFTIEFTGMMFFLYASLLMYTAESLVVEKVNSFKSIL